MSTHERVLACAELLETEADTLDTGATVDTVASVADDTGLGVTN